MLLPGLYVTAIYYDHFIMPKCRKNKSKTTAVQHTSQCCIKLNAQTTKMFVGVIYEIRFTIQIMASSESQRNCSPSNTMKYIGESQMSSEMLYYTASPIILHQINLWQYVSMSEMFIVSAIVLVFLGSQCQCLRHIYSTGRRSNRNQNRK